MLWRFKILAKLLLSHLPLGYTFWRKLGLFRLGSMDKCEYAQKIFQLHTNRAYSDGIPSGKTLLELGPGDSVASALIAHAFGAEKIYLVDTGDFATRDMKTYRGIVNHLRDQGFSTIEIERIETFDELLESCHAIYMTDGYRSLQSIRNQSIDFIWSHSVLEHIRRREFYNTISELRRILKPNGQMSHNVDLMDHLGGALNNLRFSERLWEKDFFANSGFYTNRIRYSEMAKIMLDAGFKINESDYSCWLELPTVRSDMVAPFSELPDEELKIRCCHYLLSHRDELA